MVRKAHWYALVFTDSLCKPCDYFLKQVEKCFWLPIALLVLAIGTVGLFFEKAGGIGARDLWYGWVAFGLYTLMAVYVVVGMLLRMILLWLWRWRSDVELIERYKKRREKE